MSLRSWLRRWLAEGNDSATRVTGIRQVFTGHEPHKGSASFRRSRFQSPSGRQYQPKAGTVLPMRRTK